MLRGRAVRMTCSETFRNIEVRRDAWHVSIGHNRHHCRMHWVSWATWTPLLGVLGIIPPQNVKVITVSGRPPTLHNLSNDQSVSLIPPLGWIAANLNSTWWRLRSWYLLLGFVVSVTITNTTVLLNRQAHSQSVPFDSPYDQALANPAVNFCTTSLLFTPPSPPQLSRPQPIFL